MNIKKKESELNKKDIKSNDIIEEKNTPNEIQDDIKILKKNITDLEKEELNIKLRTQAEIENIHKRISIKKKQIEQDIYVKFTQNIISLIDEFETIYSQINALNKTIKNKNIEGIKLIIKSFFNIISKYNIKKIGCIDDEFNNDLHEIDKNTIIQNNKEKKYFISKIIKSGYSFKNTVLRKAIIQIHIKK
ncbi:Protein GrpE [Buchnera aphidicola (Thelaxes suberi)]|uniref:nucleotide exchange factor GrpE n=1 Tax=Buchnera aphidicola TaxID=9 RepID=UPI003464D61E